MSNNPADIINTDNILKSYTPVGTFAAPIIDYHKENPAQWTHERLGMYFQDFEANLDEEHEIGARLVSFGQTVTFHITNIGYHGPDIINFDGIDSDGQNIQLIQNISQLSVLLIAMKKLEDKPRRIGFKVE